MRKEMTLTKSLVREQRGDDPSMFSVEEWMSLEYEVQIRAEAKTLDLPLWVIRRLDRIRGIGPYATMGIDDVPIRYFGAIR
jgi:hypothetical protein